MILHQRSNRYVRDHVYIVCFERHCGIFFAVWVHNIIANVLFDTDEDVGIPPRCRHCKTAKISEWDEGRRGGERKYPCSSLPFACLRRVAAPEFGRGPHCYSELQLILQT